MRLLFLVLLLASGSCLFGQRTKLTSTEDTVNLYATDLTNDPFGFGKNPLVFLQGFNAKLTFKLYENIHVENQLDTVFTLFIGKNNFDIIKLDENRSGLYRAEVRNKKFITKHGFQIRMKKADILEKLSGYNLKSIPVYLILADKEVDETITLKFKGERLSMISYLAYYD